MKSPTKDVLLSEASRILSYQFEMAKKAGDNGLAKELLRAWNKIQRAKRN